MQSCSGRLFNCAGCLSQTVVCSHCDRGNIYCSPACAKSARIENQRLAGQRYQKTPRGRRHHAARQAAYRARLKEKVTHQGSPHLSINDLLLPHPEAGLMPITKGSVQAICCCFCQKSLPTSLRTGFLYRSRGTNTRLWPAPTSDP